MNNASTFAVSLLNGSDDDVREIIRFHCVHSLFVAPRETARLLDHTNSIAPNTSLGTRS